jgi:hypothetical protein
MHKIGLALRQRPVASLCQIGPQWALVLPLRLPTEWRMVSSVSGSERPWSISNNDLCLGWAAWPWGNNSMTTYTDAAYRRDLGGKPYMMPVSPWFFTNMPGFDKNWLWNGGDLWYERWKQVWFLQPEFVEIISWNDYGESHYIGPLDNRQYEAFGQGRVNSPFNYADNMPHDGWRTHLPYLISTYKTGKATISQESIVTWLRLARSDACPAGGTTGNTASQLQIEFSPSGVLKDRAYISALLGSPANIHVSKGGYEYAPSWDYIPDGGVGMYHTSIPINGPSGEWTITLERGRTSFVWTVPHGTSECANGVMNWNAWVRSTSVSISTGASIP